MENWVVIFVRNGSEEKIKNSLLKNENNREFTPFLPTKEVCYRSKGNVSKKQKLLFPGYVFLKSEIEINTIATKLRNILRNCENYKYIYSILHYGRDKNDVVMRENEKKCWQNLLDTNYCITGSIGCTEGDTVYITSGTLMGIEARIKRINRHKREAIVEMEMMGEIRELKLMLEIIEKI
jgi:transcriptional antiterminator NusG